MIHDPNRPTDRDPTEPVEVQHYGPAHSDEAPRPGWQAAPAWSSTRTEPAPARGERRGRLGAAPIVTIAVVAGILSGALSAVAVTNLVGDSPSEIGGLPTETPGDADPVSEVRIDESNAVIDAVNRVAPAVVLIQATSGGVFGGATGTGSGVIYDPDGWIVTNQHVVESAESLIVELNDGRTFEATLYGTDPLTDLAIIKVDATDLPVAPVGSSSDLEPGQLAVAIGNPLGYKHTVTTGIVSGLGRQITASSANEESADLLRNLIQTDAAINPGNSGGPLVNSAGQVIGINTAVAADGAQNIGFAIPIDKAKSLGDRLKSGQGPAPTAFLGVSTTETEDGSAGALVVSLVSGGPAQSAGIGVGDLIVTFDGKPVAGADTLSGLVQARQPGDTVQVVVDRNGSTRTISVTLGTKPAN